MWHLGNCPTFWCTQTTCKGSHVESDHAYILAPKCGFTLDPQFPIVVQNIPISRLPASSCWATVGMYDVSTSCIYTISSDISWINCCQQLKEKNCYWFLKTTLPHIVQLLLSRQQWTNKFTNKSFSWNNYMLHKENYTQFDAKGFIVGGRSRNFYM